MKWHEIRPKCKENCRFPRKTQVTYVFLKVTYAFLRKIYIGEWHQIRQKCEGISVSLGKIHPPPSPQTKQTHRNKKNPKKKQKQSSNNFGPVYKQSQHHSHETERKQTKAHCSHSCTRTDRFNIRDIRKSWRHIALYRRAMFCTT